MKKRFNLLILISLILGVLGGLFFPVVMENIAFLGTIYINLLKFMIIPIIFTSIMVTIYNSKKDKKNHLSRAIITFISMFTIIFILTSLIVMLMKTSSGNSLDLMWDGDVASLKISEIITNLFPENLVTMIANNSVFACILVAFFSGLAATKIDKGKIVIEFVDGLRELSNKLIEWIIYLTPFGVFSLIGSTIATHGTTIIGITAEYIGIAYLCSIISLFIVMMLPVWIMTKLNPIDYIKKMWKLWIMTITTCSSVVTLPYTIKTCKEELKIQDKNADLYVPLGCMIHKCGGAVSFALLGIFCSNLYGIEINITTYIVMLISALLINMAAPGIPSGGIVLGATYLSILNIPLSFIAIYGGIYRLLDMSYTTLNVTGNVSANILINKELEKKRTKNAKRRVSK